MVHDEILAGLNNAVSRGESLESAKQSLVMAGYNPQEIEDGANQINMGIIGTLPQQQSAPEYKPLRKPEIQGETQKNISPSPSAQPSQKKKLPKIVIILSIILVIIILLLGFFILFGPTILDALFGKV